MHACNDFFKKIPINAFLFKGNHTNIFICLKCIMHFSIFAESKRWQAKNRLAPSKGILLWVLLWVFCMYYIGPDHMSSIINISYDKEVRNSQIFSKFFLGLFATMQDRFNFIYNIHYKSLKISKVEHMIRSMISLLSD